MKKRLFVGALVGIAATLALVAAAYSGVTRSAAPTSRLDLPASSCSKLVYGGSGKPQFLIASDLPLQGAGRAQTIQMTQAIGFIIKQHGYKAGKYTVGYQSCDDATPQTGAWDAAKCTANARAYVGEKKLIGVIGTFNSGCAKLIIPVLNRASGGPIAMVSPANTYPGLTVGGPGTVSGEPNNYYPTGKRNYARVVWTDQFQGAADALYAKKLGLKNVYVLTDKQTYGFGIATLFKRALGKLGIKTAGFEAWDIKGTSYEANASKIKQSGADAVFLGGLVCFNGGKLIKDIRAALGPKFPILAPDGFTPPSAVVDGAGADAEGVYISHPGIPNNQLKGTGKAFVTQFGAQFKKTIAPYTAYAAQAAEVLLGAIANSDGSRASVTANLFKTKVTNGILGSFSIDKNGDTTLGTVTIGQIKGGKEVILTTITPPLSFVKG